MAGVVARHGIDPFEVRYERLASDPVGTASAVLDHLGLTAAHPVTTADAQQADGLNAEWIARYERGR